MEPLKWHRGVTWDKVPTGGGNSESKIEVADPQRHWLSWGLHQKTCLGTLTMSEIRCHPGSKAQSSSMVVACIIHEHRKTSWKSSKNLMVLYEQGKGKALILHCSSPGFQDEVTWTRIDLWLASKKRDNPLTILGWGKTSLGILYLRLGKYFFEQSKPDLSLRQKSYEAN